ncbi:universal stress protein [Actinospica durhamensis]|uniref:Universal stress protein n=1 Tax=Actinospica durhamensis TaxID=1508375 RepID=A0A941IVU6_9ACTN|nr:universal stress protein [Actinospica durhamensis]MBR7837776.1 universal stress protein [Actinospica durhamensis]
MIVGVDGSPGSLETLRYALALARRAEASLVPVLAWQPGGRLAARRAPSPSYTLLLREFAETELRRAFEQGLGALPQDVQVEPWAIMGAPGPALVAAANGSNDLLIVGAGRPGRIRRTMRSSTARYCLDHATCPVFAVPPPPLQAHLPATRLRWRLEIDNLLAELEYADPGTPEARGPVRDL